jgi:hypothetical protein
MTSLAKQLAEIARVRYNDVKQRQLFTKGLRDHIIDTIKRDGINSCKWDIEEFVDVVVDVNYQVPKLYCDQEIPCEPELKTDVFKEFEQEMMRDGFGIKSINFSGYKIAKIMLTVI